MEPEAVDLEIHDSCHEQDDNEKELTDDENRA